MREILFKGFHECADGGATIFVDRREVRGEWVYGSYAEIPCKSLALMIKSGDDAYSEDTNSFIITLETKQHPYFSNAEPLQIWESDEYAVIPSTVGQYTGLTDKNGKRIFEGDIIREHRFFDQQAQDNTYEIRFERQMFVAKNTRNGTIVSLCTITYQTELEAIGTIFDNAQEVAK